MRRFTSPYDCVFGNELKGQAQKPVPNVDKRVVKLSRGMPKCAVFVGTDEENTHRWIRKIKMIHDKYAPHSTPGDYLHASKLDIFYCKLGDKSKVGRLTAQHSGQVFSIYSCNYPATCFVREALSGIKDDLDRKIKLENIPTTLKVEEPEDNKLYLVR